MPSNKKPKLIVIVGPTASGKSELAVHIAKKFNGEIISADSRQIYRELDIGTGKVAGKWLTWKPRFQLGNGVSKYRKVFVYKGIAHHCIDCVPPKRAYTATEYKKCAEDAIKGITDRGKIPIIAGGTAFWIDAVAYDLTFPDVPPNQPLRKRLKKKSPQELFKILTELDSRRGRTIEKENPRRLIRAIEIARTLGKVPKIRRRTRFDTLWIGLNPYYETWSRKMRRRIDAMLQHGLISEAKTLLKKRVSRKRIREFGFEYRAVFDYLDKKIKKTDLESRILKATLEYARRQMAWWKRNKEIEWIKEPRGAERKCRKFLGSKR